MTMDEKDFAKLGSIPVAKSGFDALGMSAPVLVQMNPEGKWENAKPDGLEEERLKAVVAHLVKSKTMAAAQSYCCQCAAENKIEPGKSGHYVPVIMMPIYSADDCPFDMGCEIQKMKESEAKPKKMAKTHTQQTAQDEDKDKDSKKKKKRGFVMQRLTDFDLLSQW